VRAVLAVVRLLEAALKTVPAVAPRQRGRLAAHSGDDPLDNLSR
jgi:hypothetical protein